MAERTGSGTGPGSKTMLKHAVVGVDTSSGWEAVRNALPPLARRLGVQLPLVIVPVDGAMAADGPILLATDGSANSAAAEAAFPGAPARGSAGHRYACGAHSTREQRSRHGG